MQEHLTDEQLAEQLLNPLGELAAREHLAACPACRDEEESLRDLLAHYRQTIRSAAERTAAFWQGQQTALAGRWTERPAARLAWAAAAAIVVLAAVLLTEKTPPAQPMATSDPDHALLVDIERSVRRELPRALEPAVLLAQEVSRSSETHSNP